MKKGERAIIIALLVMVFGTLGATFMIWRNSKESGAIIPSEAAVTTVTTARATVTTIPVSVGTDCAARSFREIGDEALKMPYTTEAPVIQKWITDCKVAFPAKADEMQKWLQDHNPATVVTQQGVITTTTTTTTTTPATQQELVRTW